MNNKSILRNEILKKRAELPYPLWKEKSEKIFRSVISHPLFKSTSIIYIYIDYKNEVSTRLIIEEAWKLNKTVAVPKIINQKMRFYKIQSFNDLQLGMFGILEPISSEEITTNHGLMIMPGVAFDSNCHRIGYGKGFYDQYLKVYPHLNTLALAFDCQIVEDITAEDHDIDPQLVVTESQIFYQKKE